MKFKNRGFLRARRRGQGWAKRLRVDNKVELTELLPRQGNKPACLFGIIDPGRGFLAICFYATGVADPLAMTPGPHKTSAHQ